MRILPVWFLAIAALVAWGAAGQGSGPNLLQNPDFAQRGPDGGPAHWTVVGGRGAVDSRARTGGASGRLDAVGRESEVWWRQALPSALEQGGRYVLTGWVRADQGAVAFLGVEPAAGAGGGQRIWRGILPEADWQRMELEFVAGGSRVAVVAGGTFSGSLYWDELSLRRADDQPERLAAAWQEIFARHGSVHTGLVVDVRGLGVERGMSPRIYDSLGNLVYAGAEASPRLVVTRGVVAYARDVEEAVSHPRLAVSEAYPYRLPLVVTALARAQDTFGASIVITREDAQRIRGALHAYDFLGRFAVIFLLD